jgi:hypothetical protein
MSSQQNVTNFLLFTEGDTSEQQLKRFHHEDYKISCVGTYILDTGKKLSFTYGKLYIRHDSDIGFLKRSKQTLVFCQMMSLFAQCLSHSEEDVDCSVPSKGNLAQGIDDFITFGSEREDLHVTMTK